MKEKTILSKLTNTGITTSLSTEQKGLIKLSNKGILIVFSFCTTLGIIALFLGEYITAAYNLIIAAVFSTALICNKLQHYITARYILIFGAILISIAGSLCFGYDTVFKYLMILPISVTFIFFSKENKWKRFSPIIIIIITTLIFEIDKFYNLNFSYKDFNNNFNEPVFTGHILESLTFLLLISMYIIIQSYFRSILSKKESELLIYKKIFDNSHEGLAIIDPDGRYIKQNSIHEKLFGYTDDELNRKSPALQMSQDRYNEIVTALKREGKYTGEFISETKDGDKHLNLMAFIINEHEKAQCVIGIFRDITEREKTLKALKKSEENLRTADAAKDKFFSIIGHDLRSPFNSLIGFSNLMIENNPSREEMKKYAKVINDTSLSTYRLLDNLLDWARIQTNSININLQYIDISEIVSNTFQNVKTQADEKNIELISNLKQGIYIKADKNMIETVIRNLVSNAVKYCSSGDTIKIMLHQKDRLALISVSDTGVGIPKEKQEKLFKIGHSISTKGTNSEKGTGLGLILCKEFVEKHGGEIWVESEVDKGSVFTFSLPRNDVGELVI